MVGGEAADDLAERPKNFKFNKKFNKEFRPVAQLAEQRSPKPQVGGSIPSWPAIIFGPLRIMQ
jgi:hypothetical protein